MPKFSYKPDTKFVEDTYKQISGREIYGDLGNVDFTKATLTVVAENEEEASAICKGITDIRMWVALPVED